MLLYSPRKPRQTNLGDELIFLALLMARAGTLGRRVKPDLSDITLEK